MGLMPGVFIVAQQTLMILNQDFVTKLWPYHHWIFLLVLTLVFSLVFYHLNYIQGLGNALYRGMGRPQLFDLALCVPPADLQHLFNDVRAATGLFAHPVFSRVY